MLILMNLLIFFVNIIHRQGQAVRVNLQALENWTLYYVLYFHLVGDPNKTLMQLRYP